LTDLLAGIDESENGYYAIVVGDADAITKNVRHLPDGFTHITSLYANSDGKRKIVDDFDFSGNIMVSCLKFGLSDLRKVVDDEIRKGRIRMPKEKINRKIGYEVVRAIDKIYHDFALKNHIDIKSIVFEIDNRLLRDYLKQGYKTMLKSKNDPHGAHSIADCIAYANYRGWTLANVVEYHDDFEQEFRKNVLSDFLKK
jgi:hypothetical protein